MTELLTLSVRDKPATLQRKLFSTACICNLVPVMNRIASTLVRHLKTWHLKTINHQNYVSTHASEDFYALNYLWLLTHLL